MRRFKTQTAGRIGAAFFQHIRTPTHLPCDAGAGGLPLPAATALPPAGCASWAGGCGCGWLLPAAASGGGGEAAALLGWEPVSGADADCCSTAAVDAVAPAAGCVGAAEADAGSGDGEAETLLLLAAVGDVLLLPPPPAPPPSALPAALAAAPALEPAAPAVGAS